MDKAAVIYIDIYRYTHNEILLSHKRNTFEPVLMRWMNLEPIIQSEVSQKEKDSNTYTKSRKMILKYLFTGQQWRNRCREQTWTWGGGEGDMYRKSNMQTYITICKIDRQQEFAVWLRKLKQGLCINLEGWNGEGDGREVQKGGDICIPMADSC